MLNYTALVNATVYCIAVCKRWQVSIVLVIGIMNECIEFLLSILPQDEAYYKQIMCTTSCQTLQIARYT